MRNWMISICVSVTCLACSSSESPVTPANDSGGNDVASEAGDASETSDGALTVPVGGEQACRDSWTPTCKEFETCAPVTFKSFFKDVNDCVDRYTKICVTIYTNPHVTNATLDRQKACGAAIPKLYESKGCSAWYRGFWALNEADPKALPECNLTGTLPTGATCTFFNDCASGYCEIPKGKFCGTCADRVPKDGSCIVTRPASCEPTTTCLSGKCRPFGELGDACDGINLCHVDLTCTAGKCAARLPAGAACDTSKGATECAINHWCNTVSAKCEPWAQAKLGQPCGISSSLGTLSACEYGAACKVTDTAAFTGVCVARAKLGEACSFQGPFESQCEVPNVCKDGVCTQLRWDTCG